MESTRAESAFESPVPKDNSAKRLEPRLDQEQVARLRAGEHDAWLRFLVDYHDVFARTLRIAALSLPGSLSGSLREDPSEVVAQAQSYLYQVFLQRFERYESEAAFRAWLFRAIQHFLQGRRRQVNREYKKAAAGNLDAVAETLDTMQSRRWVQAEKHHEDDRDQHLPECLARLSPEARATVVLRHIHTPPISLEDQAEATGESAWAVQKRYQRALAALRECLEGKGVRAKP